MYVNISLHDVTPAFEAEVRHLLDLIRQAGFLRGTILFVPNFHGQMLLRPETAFIDWLGELAQDGWEIVLHGLTHYEPVLHHHVPHKHSMLQQVVSRWFSSRSFLRVRLSRLIVPILARCWSRQELVRLVLHPSDARHPAILEIVKKLCQRMLALRSQVTIGEYLEEVKRDENQRYLGGIQ